MFGPAAADNVRHGSFTNPTGPPPPYESVITDAASHSLPGAAPGSMQPANTMHNVPGIGGPLSTTPGAAAAASNGSAQGLHAGDGAGSAAPASHFEIAVADPVKQGEGVSAFVSYKVSWALGRGCAAPAVQLRAVHKHKPTEDSVPLAQRCRAEQLLTWACQHVHAAASAPCCWCVPRAHTTGAHPHRPAPVQQAHQRSHQALQGLHAPGAHIGREEQVSE